MSFAARNLGRCPRFATATTEYPERQSRNKDLTTDYADLAAAGRMVHEDIVHETQGANEKSLSQNFRVFSCVSWAESLLPNGEPREKCCVKNLHKSDDFCLLQQGAA